VEFLFATGDPFTLTPSLVVIPCVYHYKWFIAESRFYRLNFTRRMCRCIFNHFYLTGPKR